MIETEKKYRLDRESFDSIRQFLSAQRQYFSWVDKEENIIYSGVSEDKVLRIRNINRLLYGKPSAKKWTILTVKDVASIVNGIKSRKELETVIDSDFVPALEVLGYNKRLVYEKIRTEFNPASNHRATIFLDELPFGYYMEIEGSEESIQNIEDNLEWDLSEDVELLSYPDLTLIYGKCNDGMVESRF